MRESPGLVISVRLRLPAAHHPCLHLQVFICEQQLYTRAELDRHNKLGDETGPLAESGFKGHPNCKFCKQRFYDSNELYKHMESQHEHCFICRRQTPDKYVYYRHYQELEGRSGEVARGGAVASWTYRATAG